LKRAQEKYTQDALKAHLIAAQYLRGAIFSLLLLGCLDAAYGDTEPSALQVSFKGCEPRVQSVLAEQLKRLPETLITLKRLQVNCVARELPYGFQVLLKSDPPTLTLGELGPSDDERASYRIAHLKPDELRELWHRRGLVHALALHGALTERWHLSPLFRAVNGWREGGERAHNLDPWGYSRALGRRSALFDFVTFAEEWFARGSGRSSSPDNRVECQSFTKGRALTRLFEPSKEDAPPRECAEFYAWSNRYDSLQVLFSSPTSSVVSSFGHLALLLTHLDAEEPEYEDPVFQYVGILEQRPQLQLGQLMSRDIPMILQPQSFIHFDRHTRYAEGRSLYRYQALLRPRELLWVKARLWEQLRRFESRYSFLTENCAQQLLRLLQSVQLDDSMRTKLDQPGPSTSPVGVLSVLHALDLLSREGRLVEPIEAELKGLELEVIKAQRALPRGLRPPPLSPELNSSAVERWSAWLSRRSPLEPGLARYLERLQDYFDLAGWLAPPAPNHLIPVRVMDLLKLKRDLFRQERPIDEVIYRLRRWAEEHPLGVRSDTTQAEGADTLVALISDQLEASSDELIDELEEGDELTPAQLTSADPQSWGSDGSLTLIGEGASLAEGATLGLSAALYDERQGLMRSALQVEPRDLQLFELSLQQRLDAELGQLTLSPIKLASRRGAWGVQRLGLLFSISASASWGAQPEASLQLRAGQSAQLLSWWGGAGGPEHRRPRISSNSLVAQQLSVERGLRVAHAPNHQRRALVGEGGA